MARLTPDELVSLPPPIVLRRRRANRLCLYVYPDKVCLSDRDGSIVLSRGEVDRLRNELAKAWAAPVDPRRSS